MFGQAIVSVEQAVRAAAMVLEGLARPIYIYEVSRCPEPAALGATAAATRRTPLVFHNW